MVMIDGPNGTKPDGLGDGAVDLPFDHRSPWGAIVGERERAPRRHISIYAASSPGCRIVIRWRTATSNMLLILLFLALSARR
jgi:hypothetical protein